MHEGGVALLLGHGRRREVGGEGRLLGHRIDPILRTSSGDRKLQGNGCLINPSPVQDNPQDYIYIYISTWKNKMELGAQIQHARIT